MGKIATCEKGHYSQKWFETRGMRALMGGLNAVLEISKIPLVAGIVKSGIFEATAKRRRFHLSKITIR
jgi:hypothetical protein